MKILKLYRYALVLFFLTIFPTVVVHAAEKTTLDNCKAINFGTLGDIIKWAGCTMVTGVIPLLFTLATAAFIWGIIQYFLNPENEEKRKNGKSFMIWGLITLFVMVSMWGIVNVFSNTFKIKTFIPQLSQQE